MGSSHSKARKTAARAAPSTPPAADEVPKAAAADAATATAPIAAEVPSPAVEAAPAPASAVPELFSRGYCPFTSMVRIALAYKKADYKFTLWAPNDPAPEWLAAASPDNSVPVMRLPDGSYTNQSAAMLDWVENVYAAGEPSLVPSDVGAEKVKEWLTFARAQFISSFMKVMRAPKPAIQKEFQPKLKEAIEKINAQLESHSGKYFFGNDFSMVDVVLAPIIRRLPLITYFRAVDFTTPRVTAYIAELEKTPAVEQVVWPLDSIRKSLINALPRRKAMSAGSLQHKTFRFQYNKAIGFTDELLALSPSSADLTVESVVSLSKKISDRIVTITLFIDNHADFEENIIYPKFEEIKPGSTKFAHEEHEHEIGILKEFKEGYAAHHAAVEEAAAAGDAAATLAKAVSLYGGAQLEKLKQWRDSMMAHCDGEEKHLFPLTESLGDKEVELFRKVYYHCCPVREKLLPVVLESLTPPERMQYMHNMSLAVHKVDPAEWSLCGRIARECLSKEEYDDLVERLPVMVDAQ